MNFLLAASTEGASKLQVVQPGAQNQNTTGLTASAAVREKVLPSPIILAVTSASAGDVTSVATSADDEFGGEVDDESEEHATKPTRLMQIAILATDERMDVLYALRNRL